MKNFKRLVALSLAVVMVLGLAACGKTAAPQTVKPDNQVKQPDNGQDVQDLIDQELDQLDGDDENNTVVNLGNTDKHTLPTVDNLANKDAYDETGAMTKPFDQVYPELIEEEKVAFSGESILIKLKSATLTDGLKAAGIGALEEIVPLEGAAWYEAKLTEGTDAKAALASVRELKEVLLAEYNYEIQTAAMDDYKHFDKDKEEEFKKNGHNKNQWHFHYCGIPDGYAQMENEGGDSSVIVAVVDSGVDYDHQDLKDNMWINMDEIPDNGIDDDKNGYVDDYYGVDIVAGKGSGDDTNGHGTHVAGIVAARNNNVGVLGIAYNVKIMSVKAAAHNGTLLQADIAKAVLYAYENGAEVINMSFGGTACSIAVQDALATAYTRCVLVASAGNNGHPNQKTDYYLALPNYPAALTYVLGVMSVDETGTESVFTNWDAVAFNGVEYEVYAPGENIYSTLPGDQYGYLSGTSMAAPVVSAFAAILRSEFSDRDKYPTKFIYGQLASTSENYANCCNPNKHTVGGEIHNVPQIVNLKAALTKLPKPELNLQDYYVFDDPKYSDKNNGDGVIDAGETIALGLVLRNRWGMSENTLVTIDSNSRISGLADPYITIHNPTVDYGSVGTYSTQDCGKVYTDELFTGWEDPFLITIAEDCPNDYRFTLNVTIRCENALDENDDTSYVFGEPNPITIAETVRAGYILPSVIEEDMVLTKDNLYIIPNATVIQQGVTVRVEPGTHIQFWSDDADNPYADSYIAYLLVNGKFLVEGTKEEPVYIYPSQLMDHYNVEMGSSATGYISLKYADVTNLGYPTNNNGHTGTGNNIDFADHCTFRNNYAGDYNWCRELNGGVVYDSIYSERFIGHINAKDSVFYKLDACYECCLYGSYDRCIFVQCGIMFDGSYEDCVFLDNALENQEQLDGFSNSSMGIDQILLPTQEDMDNGDYQVYYRPETGSTYISWIVGRNDEITAMFTCWLQESLGGNYVKIEDEAERRWIADNVKDYHYCVGVSWDSEKSCYTWNDGTPVDLELFPQIANKPGEKVQFSMYATNTLIYGYGSSAHLYEIPGHILPTDITFSEYTADIDLQTTYRIVPQAAPFPLPVSSFLFESSDTSVVTVDETGLVTPVGNGTADVWVYSIDRAVKNRVTITVRDYVPLEDMKFPAETVKLEFGKSTYMPCVLTPANTTRRDVIYTSSDTSVVTVEKGVLTAVGQGSATITAQCEGITTTMEVTVWVRATYIYRSLYDNYRTMESGDTSLPTLNSRPANADLDLAWTADDESILSVVDGKLIAKKPGTTILRVTDRNSGLGEYWRFTITATAPAIQADVLATRLDAGVIDLPEVILAEGMETEPYWQILDPAVAKLEDGKIVLTGVGTTTLRVTDLRNGLCDEISIYVTETNVPRVKDLQIANTTNYSSSTAGALMENGDLYVWNTSTTLKDATLCCTNVKAFDFYDRSSVTVLLEDNTICRYTSSWNDYSCQETITDLQDIPLKDVAGYVYRNTYGNLVDPIYALAEDGTVYAAGYNPYGGLGIGNTEQTNTFTKVLLNEPVAQVATKDGMAYFLTENGNLYVSGGSDLQAATPVMIARNVTWLDDNGVYFITNNRMAKIISSASEPTIGNVSMEGCTDMDINGINEYGMSVIDGKLRSCYTWMGDSDNAEYRGLVRNAVQVAMGTNYVSGWIFYIVNEDGMLFALGSAYDNSSMTNSFLGMTNAQELAYYDRPIFLPLMQTEESLTVLDTNLEEGILSQDMLKIRFNKQLLNISATIAENGTTMVVHKEFDGEYLYLSPAVGFVEGATYTLTISAAGANGVSYVTMTEDVVIEFAYNTPETEPEEDQSPDETPEVLPELKPEDAVVYEAILDETIARHWTAESSLAAIKAFIEQTQYNPSFNGNAILNPISTDYEVSHWLRLMAPSISAGVYSEIPLGGNWWGSTNETAIGLQMIDYTDFIAYARLMYAPYLTEAPENTFPFVTSVTLWNKDGEQVTTVGNEQITFRVTFNRDMDTSIPLQVRFGSAYPYGDYEIQGEYVDARTWEGTYTLNTLIENGNQYFTISNGCSATDDLELQIDQQRFGFVVDTTAAQALLMQGTATDTGIELRWTQDDFDTLMGYNVYRSTSEDGYYQRLNKTVIPADVMTWFDTTVEPGVVYYYNFTVVQTDLTESEPSGRIVIMSRDTMAPNIYHSPAGSAFTGANLVISATITDNLNVAYANLYYRIAGTEEWTIVRMNKLNDKYSAIIPAGSVTIEGIEYYIEAFDGISYTYNATAEAPHFQAVQEAISADALGDVDGDGVITNLDALLLLYAINKKYNLTAEEFARADLNGDKVLWAAEALQILRYVSGEVGSVKM